MKKKRTQSEKLFSNQELREAMAKIDSLELMGKIDKRYGLSDIFNNTNYHKTQAAIRKLTGK